jgi:hypothetical protein
MLTVTCTSCQKQEAYPSRDIVPVECPGCFKAWPAHAQIAAPAKTGNILSLTLVYMPHGQEIEIPKTSSIFLGRERHGAEILAYIRNQKGQPVISREHCEIQFHEAEGLFRVKDSNSLNGVFLGENKTPCLDSPLPLPDGETLFLGMERFLVRINYAKTECTDCPRPPKEKSYRCNELGCGYETKTHAASCPQCGAVGTLREV